MKFSRYGDGCEDKEEVREEEGEGETRFSSAEEPWDRR